MGKVSKANKDTGLYKNTQRMTRPIPLALIATLPTTVLTVAVAMIVALTTMGVSNDAQAEGATQSIGKVQLSTAKVNTPALEATVKPLQVAQSSYKGDTAMVGWYKNVVGGVETSSAEVIIDSNITYAEAIRGLPLGRDYTYANISMLNVLYVSFDGLVHQGQILVQRSIAQEVYYFFMESYKYNFPIGKVVPLSVYGWSVARASKDGATFGITTSGSSIDRNGYSIHVNPLQNRGGLIAVGGVEHDGVALGAISSGHEPFMEGMKQLGWRWGGDDAVKAYARMYKP